MSVLVYVENWGGSFKKSSFEAVGYAAEVAKAKGTEVVAVCIGNVNGDELAQHGASKTVVVAGNETFNAAQYASIISEVANGVGADVIVMSGTNNGKNLAPGLSIKFEAALITNAVAVPSSVDPLTVRRSAFSTKGFVDYKANSGKAIISIIPNAIGLLGEAVSGVVETSSASGTSDMEVSNVETASGKIPLPEAELVISAGRGLKGPENWTMVEELAELLGAGTACSKPVSDIGWRPHSEHVGQTGIQINPNLYIAIGISGAIQHLAGVNGSKTIVVINIDPEAPFFKAADYGIVGDAFEVVPKLTEAIRAFKANS
ncbi:MAG: electron transfer flavoprotein subunit alpha/FixB family protein [Schleiferiaceae bacterium]|jgi:electron transfer flavoprotein alpha subunit|nr:electron transfer flavoprotein subunit alpha/FixB family protein [Schleiferiaceae bacterium]